MTTSLASGQAAVPQLAPAASAAVGDVSRWIARAVLDGAAESTLFGQLCERLQASGVPLMRASMATNLLDPTFDARGLNWLRGQSVEPEAFIRRVAGALDEDWVRSPFRALLEGEAHMLRRRPGVDHAPGEFPLVDGLVERGATDYLAVLTTGSRDRYDVDGGMVSSWTADAPGGFTDAQIGLVLEVLPLLALVFMLETARRTTRTLVTTYLGQDAAGRVLAGNIVRGRAEKIRAVVWFSDLAGFTHLSELTESEGMLALLNDYAEVQVDAIERHGGHVLKFIGDAILAIFPHADDGLACEQALAAAFDYRARLAALRSTRRAGGLTVPDTHLALHLGDLLYGNVGSPRRLDFTVLGPAVNEAARIEALCGSLEKPVIVSSAFAAKAGAARTRLVSLGRYALKGIARPQEMFTLDEGDTTPMA